MYRLNQSVNRIGVAVLSVLLLLFLQCSKGKKSDNPQPPAPALTAASPVQGIIGDPVTLQGTNLANADKVSFAGIDSKIIQNTASMLTTVVPVGVSSGSIKIVVHTPGGASNELAFEAFPTPAHVDSLPPAVIRITPATNYTNYPVLIYGNNLSGVVKITFNDKPATVFTNNSSVVTTTVPEGLAAGSATLKIQTLKGTVTTQFQVNGAPPTNIPPTTFSIVAIPPVGYVPSISNQWSCGLFALQHDSIFFELNSRTFNDDGNEVYPIRGKYKYHFDASHNYNDVNYIEFTDTVSGETKAGMFSSKFKNPCVLNMVLISSKTGTISTCTFDKRPNDPGLSCDQ